MIVRECAVTSSLSVSTVVSDAGDVPYMTLESAGSSVVHVIVAPPVAGVAVSAPMTGGVVSEVYVAE